jgi:hypothetical protein
MNQLLSIFTTLLSSIKEYGVVNTLKAFMLMIMFSFVVRVMINPNFLFESYSQWVQQTHKKEMCLREKNDLEISKRMPVLLYKYHADRVFVVQYHNGVSDWRYGSMRFEEHMPEVEPVKYDHSNIHLSWLKLPNYLKQHSLFIGTVEEFKDVDRTLYDMFKPKGTRYIAAANLIDSYGHSVGIFGVAWNKEINLKELRNKIEQYMYEDRGIIQTYTQPQIINPKIK